MIENFSDFLITKNGSHGTKENFTIVDAVGVIEDAGVEIEFVGEEWGRIRKNGRKEQTIEAILGTMMIPKEVNYT